MLACQIHLDDKECSINDFYNQIDISMHLLNIANRYGFNVPEYQRNLVYTKAMEIRKHARVAVNCSL